MGQVKSSYGAIVGQKNCLVHYLFIFNEWERKKCNETIQVRYKEKLFNYERSEAGEQVIQESHWISSLRDLERWAYPASGKGVLDIHASASVKEGGMQYSPEVPPNCTCLRQKGRKLSCGSTETGLSCDEDVSETSLSVGDVILGNMQVP